MRVTRKELESLGSVTLGLASLVLFVLGVLWPSYVQGVFKNQIFIFLLALWCGISGVMVNSTLLNGLMAGMREFGKACRDLDDDFWNS